MIISTKHTLAVSSGTNPSAGENDGDGQSQHETSFKVESKKDIDVAERGGVKGFSVVSKNEKARVNEAFARALRIIQEDEEQIDLQEWCGKNARDPKVLKRQMKNSGLFPGKRGSVEITYLSHIKTAETEDFERQLGNRLKSQAVARKAGKKRASSGRSKPSRRG